MDFFYEDFFVFCVGFCFSLEYCLIYGSLKFYFETTDLFEPNMYMKFIVVVLTQMYVWFDQIRNPRWPT